MRWVGGPKACFHRRLGTRRSRCSSSHRGLHSPTARNDAALLGRKHLQYHELQRGGSPGDPIERKSSENSVEIGKRISNWDVVNVQEDFNYHAYIYSENAHLYRTATSGGVPLGDGLNTLSNFSFSNITDLTRTKWGDCSTFDGADCLTPKGFTFVEVQLADGVTFDLYNLHTDAVVTDADEAARGANLAQLSEYITANSAGNAVVVMGDTNTRYTRSDDTIREFVEGLGLTDGWVEYVRNGVYPMKGADAIVCGASNMTNTCEVVDKIMFRGSNYVTLSLMVPLGLGLQST